MCIPQGDQTFVYTTCILRKGMSFYSFFFNVLQFFYIYIYILRYVRMKRLHETVSYFLHKQQSLTISYQSHFINIPLGIILTIICMIILKVLSIKSGKNQSDKYS